MRLNLSDKDAGTGGELLCAMTWASGNELLSAGDDCVLQRWSGFADPLGRVATLPAPPACIAFPPSQGLSPSAPAAADDAVAVALTDGKVLLMNKSGRVEKTVQAHQGAAICLAWDADGVAFATGGEDGEVKVFSRAGMLRTALHRGSEAVYALAWSPDSARLAIAAGSSVLLAFVEGSGQPTTWKAHEGVVLTLSWNGVTGRIATGGEDCRFRVWDSMGTLLGKSEELSSVVTGVAWSPQGTLLAVGTFNACLLCDASGNVLSKQRVADVGSVSSLGWTPDGTRLAGAGLLGRICMGEVVGVTVEDRGAMATVEGLQRVRVTHIQDDGAAEEVLEYRDRVVGLSAGYGYLVVATATQCYVYAVGRWGSPHIIDAKGSVLFLIQADKCFLTADSVLGIRVFSYDGRAMCNPKMQGTGAAQLTRGLVALASDTLAVVTRNKPMSVQVLDASSGRVAGQPIEHTSRIVGVGLSQGGSPADRMVSVLDASGDLFVALVNKGRLVRIASVVTAAVWHTEQGALAAAVDGSLHVWWNPRMAFLDRELMDKAKTVKEDAALGKAAGLVAFQGSRVVAATADGVPQEIDVPPFAPRLHALAGKGAWAECMRLCRFARDPAVWAALAGIALKERELSTAEAAFAAIQAADRVEFVQHLRQIPTEEGRSAELAAFAGEFEAGEDLLLRAGLIYRALDLNMALFRWSRALELAVKHKTHVDTVLLRRQQYLAAAGLEETDGQFLQFAGKVPLDPEAIDSKVRQEIEAEAAREGARRYQPPGVAAA